MFKKLVCLVIVFINFIYINLEAKSKLEKASLGYSFFVAGHTYGGGPLTYEGLYPPFVAKLEDLNMNPLIKFGIFTGDIVQIPTKVNWDRVDAQLKKLTNVITNYFSPGNHDLADDRENLFISRYGPRYYHFKYNNDLFIVLDSNEYFNTLNTSGNQIIFFKNVIKKNYKTVDNILIFFHHVLWVEKDSVFSNIRLNVPYNESIFWSDIYPEVSFISN